MIRTRELTSYGSWPWRYVVERKVPERMSKGFLWFKPKRIPETWERLPHSLRGYEPMQIGDALTLASHYRDTEVAAATDPQEGGEK